MDVLGKKMTTELEKAIQEIERLRQENAQLRKKLGIEVSEPKSDYRQPSSAAPCSHAVETQEFGIYGEHGFSMSAARPPGVDSSSSNGAKIKLFRTLFRGREDIYAVRAVLSNDMGVLIAPPGAGKPVMGCYAVAERNVPTLILAHRKPILDQWRAQLGELLGLSPRMIGQVCGGRNRQTGIIDLGMMQSLKRFDDLESFFSKYGFIIVDECHH
jgi:hypothetical protein